MPDFPTFLIAPTPASVPEPVSPTSTPSSSSQDPLTHGKIVVVSLTMMRSDPGIKDYEGLTARKKIELIEQRIELIVKELKRTHPDALWIIAWREGGITENNSRFISLETLDYFKKSMLALTKTYANLAILAGTVAVKRQISSEHSKGVLSKIARDYEYLAEEEVLCTEQLKDHYDQVSNLLNASEAIDIEITSNSTYFIQGGGIKTYRKRAPYDENVESDPTEPLANTVFKPASSKTDSPYFSLLHPKKTGLPVPIAIEICYEHHLGVLSSKKGEKPLIHFILSDSTFTRLQHIHGHVAIRCDSQSPVSLMIAEKKYQEFIHVFQHNILCDRALPLVPVRATDISSPNAIHYLNGGFSLFAQSKFRSKTAIAHWTTLLENWVETLDLDAKTKAGEAVRRFSAQYPGELPMKYVNAEGNTILLKRHATKGSDLAFELDKRSLMATLNHSSPMF